MSKVSATMLKRVGGKIISSFQMTFIPGRQVLDGMVVVNEIIDLESRSKKDCLLIKDDFKRPMTMLIGIFYFTL